MALRPDERGVLPASPTDRRVASGRVVGAGCGLSSAAVALGVAELVASARRSWKSPVLDVGDRVVDLVPPPASPASPSSAHSARQRRWLAAPAVICSTLSSADLAQMTLVKTVNGAEISLETEADGTLKVNGQATVGCADIQTANATVHVIDAVLLP